MDWFSNENFWRELYPFMFSPERIAAAPGEVDQVLALAGFQGRSVLDLCCGPGRHSIELATRGFAVTGVDRSPFLLERARDRAAKAGVAVEWIEADMRHFERPSAFDLALSLFTSFGYFETDADNRQVLRNVRNNLAAGGTFVIDVLGKERLARVWKDTICTEAGEALLIQRPTVIDDWSRIHNRWAWIQGNRVTHYEFTHWLYSARELKERLHDAGFAQVLIFGSLDGSPYDVNPSRLVAVARRSD